MSTESCSERAQGRRNAQLLPFLLLPPRFSYCTHLCLRRGGGGSVAAQFPSPGASSPKGTEDALAALMTEAGMEEQATRLRRLKVRKW